jgi:hypothetical protein
MKLYKQFKNIKRKGISEILFIAFAIIAVIITIMVAFR